MRPRTAGLVIATVAAALASAAVGAWLTERPPAPTPPPSALDADGDPLPPWAVCRVGSARFRCAEAFVSFTPDGRRIVHGTTDGCVRIIDRRTGAVVREFAAQHGEAGRSPPRSLLHEVERSLRPRPWRDTLLEAAVSPDGTRVVTRGYNTTNVYELTTGRSVARWRSGSAFGPLAWSPDGKRVVAIDFQAGIDVRDAATGTSVLTSTDSRPVSRGFGGEICAAVSPDGSLAAVQTCKLRVVDLATGAEKFATEPGDFAGPLAFSPDGAFLLHVRKNEAVVVCDTRTWNSVREFAGGARALAFCPDGSAVAIAGEKLRLVDFATGAPRAEFPVGATRIAFSPDGSALAALSGATVRVFDLVRGVEDPPAPPPFSSMPQLAWSPDGRRLAIGDDGVLRFVDPTTGRIAASHDTGGLLLDLSAFSRDGRHVAVTSRGVDSHLWVSALDTESEADPPRSRLSANGWTFWDVRAGRLRAVDQGDDALRVRDAADGQVVVERREFPRRVLRDVNAVDGFVVVRGGTDREFDVHDLATGALLAEIVVPAALTDVDGSDLADGRLVLRDVDRGAIAVFDARSGARQVVIEAGASLDGWPAITRDGRLVAAFDVDHAIRVFDGADGRELAILRGHRGGLRAIAFSPDGRRLASASEDGTILVWDVAGATGR